CGGADQQRISLKAGQRRLDAAAPLFEFGQALILAASGWRKCMQFAFVRLHLRMSGSSINWADPFRIACQGRDRSKLTTRCLRRAARPSRYASVTCLGPVI